MANKKQPDTRVPNPLGENEKKIIYDFFALFPSLTAGLYSISTDDVKGFKKMSPEETDYVDDVVTEMTSPSNLVASNVNVKNIQAARTAAPEFEKIGNLFIQAGQLFLRNNMQADSYGYQQASIFEGDTQSAIYNNIKGAVETKERLEANRKKRNTAAAATRQATAARVATEKTAAEAEAARVADEKAAKKAGKTT